MARFIQPLERRPTRVVKIPSMSWYAAIIAAVAALLIACSDEQTLPEGGLTTRVCADEPGWERPALDEHRAHIVADPRYRAFGARNLEAFEAHFWSVGHSASGAGTILKFSGMWNMPNEGRDFYWGAGDRCFSRPDRDEYLPVWLFEHEIVSAREVSSTIEVEVKPRETGVQIVSLHLPERIYGREKDLVFVDAGGAVIEEMKSIWSAPP